MAEKKTDLDRALEDGGIPVEPASKKREPVYKMIGALKIPVSKSMGKFWQSRRDAATSHRKSIGIEDAWGEAIRYYKNDQTTNRSETDGNKARNRVVANAFNNNFAETENVVFSNVNSLVPALYSKNPRAEITPSAKEDEAAQARARTVEMLVNKVASKKHSPGINLKLKARRAVVNASLTNTAWVESGFTKKIDSSEAALEDLRKLSEQLEKAKEPKDIERIEGELLALEETINLLEPPGPWAKFLRPQQLLIDTSYENEDLTDAKWAMKWDMMSTAYLTAVFGKDGRKTEVKSIFAPTHILNIAGNKDLDDEINNFSLLEESADTDWQKAGYPDKDSYDRSLYTKVWFVWDRITRRVYLFHDKDWSWPIWVWDDPYGLEGFYPFSRLTFYTDPETPDARGEVTYYLDQQDAINEINDEERRARHWVRRNVFFDKNRVSQTDVDAVLKGVDDTARGVDLPDGMTLKDVIFSFAPPSMNFPQLFDKSRKYEAINKISAANEIMSGGQFKTNTTNQAIERYDQAQNIRLDEKVDLIEDFIGDIMWKQVQLCLRFMSAEMVQELLGQQIEWRNLEPAEIQREFSVRVVGGSTAKPTTRAKKREAIELGQVLGQFASASPAAIIVALKLFEQAFDEITISAEDWQFIQESIVAQLQQGGPGQGEGGEIEQQVDALPPEAKVALGNAMARGVPAREALSQILNAAQQQQPQPQ